MVLLTSLAMHPARSRPPSASRDAPSPSSSNNSPTTSPSSITTPYPSSSSSSSAHLLGHAHNNGYFYSPSHSAHEPCPAKGSVYANLQQQQDQHQQQLSSSHRIRRNSSPTTTMTSSETSSLGVYSSLSGLDTWSPNSVSITSLLAGCPTASSDAHSSSSSKSSRTRKNGFVHVSDHGRGSRGGSALAGTGSSSARALQYDSGFGSHHHHQTLSPSLADDSSAAMTAMKPPETSTTTPAKNSNDNIIICDGGGNVDDGNGSGVGGGDDNSSGGRDPKWQRALRRTVSADPRRKDRDPYLCASGSRPLGSPLFSSLDGGGSEDSNKSCAGGAIPRVCSDGDLLESEYVTLDYAYYMTHADRGGRPGEDGGGGGGRDGSRAYYIGSSGGRSSSNEGGLSNYSSSSSRDDIYSSSGGGGGGGGGSGGAHALYVSMDNLHRKHSDITGYSSSSSSINSNYNNNSSSVGGSSSNYHRYYSDENNYFYANGYSSDYNSGSGSGGVGMSSSNSSRLTGSGGCSSSSSVGGVVAGARAGRRGRWVSGSTGSLQRSGTLPSNYNYGNYGVDAPSQRSSRTMSAERLCLSNRGAGNGSSSGGRHHHHVPRTASPMERGSRATPPRKKKNSQTLQTVAENIPVQGGVTPGKGILKNGTSSSSSSSNNNNGSGANTPRSDAGSCNSNSNSRRSSLTSSGRVNDSIPENGSKISNSGMISADFTATGTFGAAGEVPGLNNTPLHAPPAWTPSSPLNSILLKHNNLSSTFGGTSSVPGSSSDANNPKDELLLPLHHRTRLRSKSLSDLRSPYQDGGEDVTVSGCYSDDEDGDDFGFLSHPALCAGGGGGSVGAGATGSLSRGPTAMHKAKTAGAGPASSSASSASSSSASHRLLPRRWRNMGKAGSASSHPAQPMWSPEGPCTWCSVSGRKVILKPVSILQLSEAERLALQKLAVSRLQSMGLACPIVIPKDAGDGRRMKKRALSLKRRSKSANLSSLLDTLTPEKGKDKENKETKPVGLVFGLPLSRCIANDKELAKKRARTATAALKARSDSADHVLSSRHGRKSSSSSQGSMDNGAQNGTSVTANPYAVYDSARRAASSDSLSESDHSSRNTSSSLIEALSLHTMPEGARAGSQAVGSTPQVPHIVDACFKHLETYGLQVLGIFRVGSSKKRVKQLREEFDSGKEVVLTDEHNPHDIGALLKEFFRDLPEPLLTRDLYPAFVATRKLKDREVQAEAVRLLLALLPAANRDTLWALMRFLATVHRHSADSVDRHGQEIPGNKMDSHNLATLFGPNVLHRARAINEKQFMAECAEQAEQTSEVIGVVKDMIDNHFELFEISAKQRDEVLKLMLEADQENLDKVLRRLSNENQIEPDPESVCSVFESESDSCTQSLPHSASSDADLLSLARRRAAGGVGSGVPPYSQQQQQPPQPTQQTHQHQPLRASRSADPWTDPAQHPATPRATPSPTPVRASHPFADGGRRVRSVDNALAERFSHSPSPHDSPSLTGPPAPPPPPPPVAAPPPYHQSPRPGSGSGSVIAVVGPVLTRPPLVTISQDSPEVVVMRVPSASRARQSQDTNSGGGIASSNNGNNNNGNSSSNSLSPRPLSTHSTPRERPISETFSTGGGSLNIPRPAYRRENSGASSASSSYLSSSGGAGGHTSDSSTGGHWVLPTPPASRGSSPAAQRRSDPASSSSSGSSRPKSQSQSSRRRPLLTSSSRSDDDDSAGPAAVGSPEWQRERWRHWEQITAGRNSTNPHAGRAGDSEQETLV